MKTIDAVKLAGIVFAGVAAYLVVTRTVKAGGDVVAGVKKVITEDLNPASTKNVVYTTVNSTEIGQSITEKIGDFLGSVFDRKNYLDHQNRLKQLDDVILKPTGNGGASNTSDQARSALANQSNAETNRLKRYELQAASAESARNLFNYNMENPQ